LTELLFARHPAGDCRLARPRGRSAVATRPPSGPELDRTPQSHFGPSNPPPIVDPPASRPATGRAPRRPVQSPRKATSYSVHGHG
jgi:hypothetical protein